MEAIPTNTIRRCKILGLHRVLRQSPFVRFDVPLNCQPGLASVKSAEKGGEMIREGFSAALRFPIPFFQNHDPKLPQTTTFPPSSSAPCRPYHIRRTRNQHHKHATNRRALHVSGHGIAHPGSIPWGARPSQQHSTSRRRRRRPRISLLFAAHGGLCS